MEEAHRSLTIVVPIKNERRSTLRGVLAGIPGGCRVVVVSASELQPIDRFQLEREVIDEFVMSTRRDVLHIHQRDAVEPGHVLAGVDHATPSWPPPSKRRCPSSSTARAS